MARRGRRRTYRSDSGKREDMCHALARKSSVSAYDAPTSTGGRSTGSLDVKRAHWWMIRAVADM